MPDAGTRASGFPAPFLRLWANLKEKASGNMTRLERKVRRKNALVRIGFVLALGAALAAVLVSGR